MQADPVPPPPAAAGSEAVAALPSGAAGLSWRDLPRAAKLRIVSCCAYLAVVTLCFSVPLAALLAYASSSHLHSHIPLIPLIVIYLLYEGLRGRVVVYRTSIAGAMTMGILGATALALAIAWSGRLSTNDYLSLLTLAYVSFIGVGGFAFLGGRWMAAVAFPMGFLVFMIPLPDGAVYWLERSLVVASAEAAAFLFRFTGTPFLHDGTYIRLPGIVLHVANECSGIRSTWVLFITSLLAAHQLLRTGTHRLALVALVLPLGIVRNAARIVVIGLLCVHIGPQMIDSEIHRRGGPVFFALSLVPLFLTAIWLHRRERRLVTVPLL